MTSTTADRHRPFSLDPAQWPRQWRAAAMLALDGPLLRGLRPASRVALRHADGQTRVWRLVRGQAHAVPGAPGGAELPALQLPAERVLERRLLRERPDARGLAVPGMPIGSPGMEHPQGIVQPYTVSLILKDGSVREFSRHP